MAKKFPLSVVLSVYNEEANIEACLASVDWAAEIIVVDNNSSDATAKIAKKYTKHVVSRENNLMLNINKNFGFQKATNEWILNIDADERVSEELASEIQQVLTENVTVAAYKIPRKNIIFGKWIEHTGWYPDYQIRLFRKGKGKFAEKHVHELLLVEGTTETLSSPLIHYNYVTIQQFMQKLMYIYAPNEAEQRIADGYVFDWKDTLRFPLNEFLSRYFARQGYKDGLHGLVLSLFMGFYHLVVFGYVWEKQGYVSLDEEVTLASVKDELKKSGKDMSHWLREKEIEEEQQPLVKLYKKIKHRYS